MVAPAHFCGASRLALLGDGLDDVRHGLLILERGARESREGAGTLVGF